MKRILVGGRYILAGRTLTDGEEAAIAIAVDGSIITTLSATDNAVLDAIAASLVTLAAAVPGGQTIWRATAHYASAQTDTELVATPGAGLSLYITDILISNGPVAGNILLEEDTGSAKTAIIQKLYFGVNGGTGRNFQTPLKLTANKNLGITSVSCTNHSITVSGYTAA